ncbi:hypothetical protein EV382_1405 [Micromonospora violae]|uniref:DivIVA domain-containing protein n=1 Tax=Micromonospora violae TaxID=1278207 RepID=A0A4Q7UFN3_9ACTN|nr:ATPase [Micromonospora violae]RZT78223.1 hypothetical protein EV382_1405 [Micromonospora violae]
MRFSVVETGYDQRQVDDCLDELAIRLSRLAARAERAAGEAREWDEIRQEAAWLSGLLHRLDLGDAAVGRRVGDPGRREARVDEILGQVTAEQVPPDTPTAAAGVPGRRVGVGGRDAQPPPGRR